ncbi:hypothetical protein [Chitinophaga sp.]|uniref:hypothetical protein n=1 Tax=Chitinophaga sp. TaxID=1869181 RepID=UPI0031E2E6FD
MEENMKEQEDEWVERVNEDGIMVSYRVYRESEANRLRKEKVSQRIAKQNGWIKKEEL